MGMQDRGRPAIRPLPPRQLCARPGERREAFGIVGVIPASVGIWPARAVEKVRGVKQQERHPAERPFQHPRLAAEQVRVAPDRLRPRQPVGQTAIGGQQHAHVPALPGQRGGQGARDIGQPAGLDQRHRLGRDRKNPRSACHVRPS